MFILKFHDKGGVPSPSGRRSSTMASERGTIHIIEDIIDTDIDNLGSIFSFSIRYDGYSIAIADNFFHHRP